MLRLDSHHLELLCAEMQRAFAAVMRDIVCYVFCVL